MAPSTKRSDQWLDALATYLSREDRFMTDKTMPHGESTVEGLRRAANELRRRAVCPHVAARMGCGVPSVGNRDYVSGWRCDDCPGYEDVTPPARTPTEEGP